MYPVHGTSWRACDYTLEVVKYVVMCICGIARVARWRRETRRRDPHPCHSPLAHCSFYLVVGLRCRLVCKWLPIVPRCFPGASRHRGHREHVHIPTHFSMKQLLFRRRRNNEGLFFLPFCFVQSRISHLTSHSHVLLLTHQHNRPTCREVEV